MQIVKKHNKKLKWLASFAFLIPLVTSVTVYADVVIQKAESLLSKQYSLDTYKSYMDTSKGFWGFVMGDTEVNIWHSIVNVLFSIIKVIWGIVDKALALMFGADPLKETTSTVTEMANSLWEKIEDNYLPLMIVLALLVIAFTFVTKSSQQAIKQLAKLFLVVFVSMLWFGSGESILNTFNDFTNDLQANIMSSANGTDFMNDVEVENGEIDDNITVIRNMYFDQAVKKPFYLLNYGTANENSIKKNKKYGEPTDLLAKKATKKNVEKIESNYKKQADSGDYDNSYLTSDKIDHKTTVVIFSFVSVILYSICLFVIAFLNFVLQMGALLLYYALPLLALLSIIPMYSNALFNGIAKVFQLLLMKAILGLGILVISLLTLIVDTLFAPTGIFMFALNMIIKGLVLVVAWKSREKIIKVITNGIVQAQMKAPKVINDGMSKAQDKVQDKVQDVFSNGRKKYQKEDGNTEVAETGGSAERPDYSEQRTTQHYYATGSSNDETSTTERTEQTVDEKESKESVQHGHGESGTQERTEQQKGPVYAETETADTEGSLGGNQTDQEVDQEEFSDIANDSGLGSNDEQRDEQSLDQIDEEDGKVDPNDRTQQQVDVEPILNHDRMDQALEEEKLDDVEQAVNVDVKTDEADLNDLEQHIPDDVDETQEINIEQQVSGQREVDIDETENVGRFRRQDQEENLENEPTLEDELDGDDV
ncbi:putative membrane protein YddG [Tetragenococcus halophilus subsp. flandriensis]|uniref:CD3337/EF1877 family mobilome membrane protein n=1 Tax=Tetragenococcus halophilus TaxID=51669 RepID=UPI0023E98255|nr:hypothetical protein [Tetragenococcus halophilus]GMA08267.1 putative membrane protein YddG [Tetragenococcus halophilus subsp. flandriensis]